ncbi:MAG: EamA family transporter [Proteobacteria bacterium]|nr:EamA family transporter [Pseudomonadota bacterium]
MEIIPLLLVIGSAFIHAFWNMLAKKGRDTLSFLWWSLIFGFAIYSFFFFTFAYDHDPIPSQGFMFILLSAIFHSMYFTSLGVAYYRGDLSLVYPIARSAPIFVLILAIWFLGENLSLPGILGILTVVFGAYIIGFPTFSVTHFVRPIRLLKVLKDRSYQLAWLTALIISLYSVNDKVGVRYVHPFLYLYLVHMLTCILFSPYVLMRKKASLFQELKENKSPIILGGIMIPSSYLLILYAMTMGNVSYIVAVRQLSIVFAVLLGTLLLKEKHGLVRFLASLCIFSGVFLISYWG